MQQSKDGAWKIAAVGGGVAACAWQVAGQLGWNGAPAPFAWSDVALVSLIATLPLAALTAERVRRLAPGPVCLAMALVAAVAGVLCLTPLAAPAIPAVLLGLAMVLGVAAVRPAAGAAPPTAAMWILVAAIAAIVPRVYVAARCRADRARLVELARQSRLGEAQIVAERLLLLAPEIPIENVPLARIVELNQRTLDELAERAAEPLPPAAPNSQRLERAQDLAVLGRTAEALATLSSPALAQSAAACHLRGSIFVARGQYLPALAELQEAREAPEHRIDALRQIALCQRKLGHYAQAEQTYRELLEQSPTAESHFLAAQFYEDAQQTSLARDHARQAAALDPNQYERRSRQLIDRLNTRDFGCWGAFKAEH